MVFLVWRIQNSIGTLLHKDLRLGYVKTAEGPAVQNLFFQSSFANSMLTLTPQRMTVIVSITF